MQGASAGLAAEEVHLSTGDPCDPIATGLEGGRLLRVDTLQHDRVAVGIGVVEQNGHADDISAADGGGVGRGDRRLIGGGRLDQHGDDTVDPPGIGQVRGRVL